MHHASTSGSELVPAVADPLVEPAQHLVVPDEAVLAAEHPVVLAREVEQLRRHPPALQGGEGREALAVDDAVVLERERC